MKLLKYHYVLFIKKEHRKKILYILRLSFYRRCFKPFPFKLKHLTTPLVLIDVLLFEISIYFLNVEDYFEQESKDFMM